MRPISASTITCLTARWSALELSLRLLLRLVRTFVAAGGELTFVIDETLERRWGRCITRRGHYRS
jgi:hypothetical protein